MEAKYSKLSVFICSILAVISLSLCIVWFYSSNLFVNYQTYYTYCPNSVAGLYEGSFVTYKGVQIGKVSKLDVMPNHDIQVTLMLESKIPITDDTYATLAMKGLTGYVTVELLGGTMSAPKLQGRIIPYKPSIIEKLMHLDTTDTHDKFVRILDSINDILPSLKTDLHSLSQAVITVTPHIKTLVHKSIKLTDRMGQAVCRLESGTLANLEKFTERLANYGVMATLGSSVSL